MGDEGIIGKAFVFQSIRHYQEIVRLQDGMGTKGQVSAGFSRIKSAF